MTALAACITPSAVSSWRTVYDSTYQRQITREMQGKRILSLHNTSKKVCWNLGTWIEISVQPVSRLWDEDGDATRYRIATRQTRMTISASKHPKGRKMVKDHGLAE
jgi:hypothetical protein